MKKRLLVLILALAMAAGITFLIVSLQERSELERINRLTHVPASKPHQHVSPDGEIVEHTHIYDTPTPITSTETAIENDTENSSGNKDYMKMNAIQRIWSNLDLDAIKREFQPYTLEEIHEKWRNHPYVPGFTGRTSGTERSPLTAVEVVDNFRNRDEWIQRLYALGYPFLRGGQYAGALQTRSGLKHYYDNANDIPPHERVALPPEVTWEEIEDTFMKHWVIAEITFERAYQADPDNFAGGVFNINAIGKGVLTPFKENTVYVHISEDMPFSQITGAKLAPAEKEALMMFGIAPKGMKVIYTDKNGIPLPPDVKPRFYESVIQALDAAEKRVEKMIADHDALFKQKDTESSEKLVPTPSVPQPDHLHPHEGVSSIHTEQRPGTQQKVPLQVGKNTQSPLPPDPPGPAQIEKWFEELLLLHGGDLPKDLKALEKVINELKVIRQAGEEKRQPKGTPPGHRSPERSKPKAPTPSELPAAQE